MHIVHVEDQFFSTAGYQVNYLAKWNRKNGNEVTIITSDDFGAWGKSGFIDFSKRAEEDKEYCEKNDVNMIRLKSKGYVSGRVIFENKIYSTIKSLKPDIVMVHGITTLTGMRFLRKIKRLPYPVIFDSHMVDAAVHNKFTQYFNRYFKTFLTPKVVKNNVSIIALDEDCKLYLTKNFNIPENLVEVITWGSETDQFKPNLSVRTELRNRYNIKEEDFVMVSTGKISEEKKVLMLATALEKKLSEKRDTALVLVGSGKGDYAEQVEETLKLCENKIIRIPTQKVTNLPPFYQMADLAVWPGQCSLSYFDAQAVGLPVVAEDIPPNVKRMQQNNGYVFRQDDSEDLRNTLIKCVEMDPNELSKLGQNGKEIVENKYSWNMISVRCEKQFLKIMNQYKQNRKG
ncbi:MAG: hypothetical protein K0Q49_2329 [Haloplasmataceae bacterium]|jgi:glycosyltransferase involved in cell wall biosynthesis|nr:hypothetical protein [Haloplasmataceae bacterium]